jgi:hypothetical protein
MDYTKYFDWARMMAEERKGINAEYLEQTPLCKLRQEYMKRGFWTKSNLQGEIINVMVSKVIVVKLDYRLGY